MKEIKNEFCKVCKNQEGCEYKFEELYDCPDIEERVDLLTAFLINGHTHGGVLIDNTLEGFYKALGCSVIEIHEAVVGGETFVIVCDEEGRLKDNFVSVADNAGRPVIVGPVLLCRHNGEGDLTPLNEFDVNLINSRVGSYGILELD